MRWQFPDANNAAEEQARTEVLRRIDAFWGQFVPKAPDLVALFQGKAQWDLPGWMNGHLHAIDPRLMWEFAVAPDGYRLVITPESHRALRPLVQVFLARAPRLPGWTFAGYRVADTLENTATMLEARTGGTVEGYAVRVAAGGHHDIDLRFFSPGCKDADDTEPLAEAMVLVEGLLGEETLDHWIGVIDTAPALEAPPEAIPLDRLAPTVNALIDAIQAQLPAKPYRELDLNDQNHKWSMFQLEADEAHDYPLRWDLITMISAAGNMAQAAHAGPPFSSRRFSRCGETFAYLKVDGREGLSDFADREAMEEAVDAALRPAGVGCVIGGGTGLRYSYVDLALTDVPRAIELLRDTLRPHKLPERSWLLFYDADWADEWVGLYDQTPPPPQA